MMNTRALPATLLLAAIGASAQGQFPETYGKLPLSFEPNHGQTDAQVQFISRGAGYTIFVGPTSATFALERAEEAVFVRMDLRGANRGGVMEPLNKLPGTTNYLMGSTRAKWPTNLPTYAKTRSRNVYRGIDLVYYGTQGRLEYDFVLAPQADPHRIRMRFAGAVPRVDTSGDLVLCLDTKRERDVVRFHKPLIYQQIDGIREPVDGRFIVAAGTHEVGFAVGAYDRTRELVIDPVLVYSSYLGGSSQQSVINAMAVDAAGAIYVTGVTNAVDFPTTPGVISPTCPAPQKGGTKCGISSSSSAFVSKISPDGKSLIYSTYLGGGGSGPGTGGPTYSVGGSGSDFGTGIAVDAQGNAWVVGGTNSNNFPVTANAYSLYCAPASASFDFNTIQYVGEFSDCARFNAGGEYVYSDGNSLFLVKLNPTGTSILYGTFLGGTQGESQGQIALDSAGNIYIAGTARSEPIGPPAMTGQFLYPTTPSAFQTVPQASAFSPFVTKLAPDGRSLLYSSFLSANKGQVFNLALAIGAGKIFIGGLAQTPSLPTTAGALSTTCPGTATQCVNNGFVAEFDPTKSGAASLVFSTYLNGKHVSTADASKANSAVTALAADAAGNVYAAGNTQYRDFPTTAGVLQPTCFVNNNDACNTAFVTKLSPAGALVWSTFYGSPSASGQFGVSALALDANNNVYIANLADGAGDLPLKNPIQNYASGNAYITELSSDGSKVLFGSFFGNGSNILPVALAVDATGNIYLTGNTAGTLPLANAYQSTNAGGFMEGFFAKIANPAIAQAAFSSTASAQAGPVAAGSIVTAYAAHLASADLTATTVTIVDSKGVTTTAPLFFVSPGQVNFLIPATVANGPATITIAAGDGTISSGTITVVAVAPGLFTLPPSGLVAANVVTVNADGSQTPTNSFQVLNGAVVPLPINVGPPAKQVILILYATGIANRSSLANVSVTVGGMVLPALYAGPQGGAGLDQVNVTLPASLAGAGDTAISITADSIVSNTGRITIK
jgi:uncharacterized protein (TIGR03437 family)